MGYQKKAEDFSPDEIDLFHIVSVLWREKWILVTSILVFAISGVIFALSSPNTYQATVVVAPSEDEGSRLNNLGGQIGSLASLAGINIGESGSIKIKVAKEKLESGAFIARFIQEHQLAPAIAATKGWNEKTREWIYDSDIYNPKTQVWRITEEGESLEPSDWDLVKEFKSNHLSISDFDENGFMKLSIRSYSPFAAKRWVELIVRDINEHMRSKQINESERRIKFLENKLSETKISGMQKVFFTLIENEMRAVMLANAKEEYVFSTIDSPMVPEEKVSPQRAIIAVISTLVGGIFGIFLAYVNFLRRKLHSKYR